MESRTRRMENVANGGGTRRAKLPPPPGTRPEAWRSWYGSHMETRPLSHVNGEPIRRPRRPAAAPEDGLHRYRPVPPVFRDEDGYLLEDGMSRTDRHLSQTTLWYHALKRRLPTATVCSDLPLHYRRDDTDATLVPDLFVALRAPRREGRHCYKLWEHPAPDLVIEMLSRSTSKKDAGPKLATYEHLGVRECWLFDPEGFELPAPLAGHRLFAGRYQPIAADAAGRLPSEVLGLGLHVRAGDLRFRDPATGRDLRTYDEAEQRGDAEKNRADAAELGRAAERSRADAEKIRADAAERELARLRLRLKRP